jgi:tRNA-Thr(GGU) m(6)t(6)A37 methyltransferase TsaA
MKKQLKQIGIIHSIYKVPGDAPRQGRLNDTQAEIEIFDEYTPGLKDITTCTHLFILYWLDRADRTRLSATPPGEKEARGVFATRSQHRPNPIGIGIVNFLEKKENRLIVSGLDALDGTPVLDIKPYISKLDCIPGARMGWFTEGETLRSRI